MEQLAHSQITNTQQQFPITIICDAIRTPENIGMCFRIAESFGVSKIYTHQDSPSVKNNRVQRTARNTISKTTTETYPDFEKLIQNLKEEGNSIVGIEITNNSIAIQKYNFKQHSKIVIVLGNERNGIQKTNVLDVSVDIPMYGTNSSMNVIHSLTIALYEITNQINNIK